MEGQPALSAPKAAVFPSGQQPNHESSQLLWFAFMSAKHIQQSENKQKKNSHETSNAEM
jgi:hypothetical protein